MGTIMIGPILNKQMSKLNIDDDDDDGDGDEQMAMERSLWK